LYIGPPWLWETIHHHLDVFRDYAFGDEAANQLHHHRVTLFRYYRWRFCFRRWPWSGWLVPVERSGHTTRRTGVAFKAPDNADQAEGVAGVTWASRELLPVESLPILDNSSSEADIQTYATRTWVSEKWIEHALGHGKILARSYVGIPVLVKGVRWGVLVLDSRGDVRTSKRYRDLYNLLAAFLSKLLERT
jgi:hypothetical protein